MEKLELPKNLWIKSQTELEQERQGMKLLSNWSPGFNIPGRNPVRELYQQVQKYEAETEKRFEQKMFHEAYDNLTCRIVDGHSMYIRAPELIIDSQVVLRDWQTLKDEEFKENVEEILKHAERCRSLEEQAIMQTYGVYGFYTCY